MTMMTRMTAMSRITALTLITGVTEMTRTRLIPLQAAQSLNKVSYTSLES